MGLKYFLSKLIKGEQGEIKVLESITFFLKNSNEDNFFLLHKVQIPINSGTKEIDLLLLHPIFGIYIIEVKNWNSLDSLNDKNNPFTQANQYRNYILSFLQDRLKKVSINVEYRVIFPSISIKQYKEFANKNKYLDNFKNQILLKDSLNDKNVFKEFFKSSAVIMPNNKEFMNIISYFVDVNKIKQLSNTIMPIITKDEIVFFDYKQLSILNGYTGGFWIIRGVAGTGKTIILTKFIQNKIDINNTMQFLVLCFNTNLSDSLNDNFDEKYKKNITSISLLSFLSKIHFNYDKIGVDNNSSLDDKMYALQEEDASIEFKTKFRKYLESHPIDYFLCDETQDMPSNIMRIIYEEINDCIFFIDEAQRFYSYSMNSIADIFHHKHFKKLNMKGRVKNLKNVYRTPSNIAKCAFDILSLDDKLNKYYKQQALYLEDNFLNDINFILEDGSIQIQDWSYPSALDKLINDIDDDIIILTNTNIQKKSLDEHIKLKHNKHSIKVMTFQAVKGLEAKNIILYHFDEFLNITLKYNEDLLYRKAYVVLTRSLSNIYISLSDTKNLKNDKASQILEIIKSHSLNIGSEQHNNAREKYNLANLNSEHKMKNNKEIIVTASKLFSVISGLFGSR